MCLIRTSLQRYFVAHEYCFKQNSTQIFQLKNCIISILFHKYIQFVCNFVARWLKVYGTIRYNFLEFGSVAA
jgi:hypothetical protein